MRISHSFIFITLAALPLLDAQSKKPQGAAGEWPMYNRDLSGSRFSPLAQINTKNVGKLTQAWTYKLPRHPSSGGITGGYELTPIVVDGVMYLTSVDSVVALEPETGKELWRYRVAAGQVSKRGVAYWPGDQNNAARIIFTAGRKMVGLNAKTGKLDPGFGKEGEVDMVVPYDSAPVVYKNMLLVGANTGEAPATGQPGDTRGYDARTGAKVWDFHSVPQPGEPGHETWEGDGWKDRDRKSVV